MWPEWGPCTLPREFKESRLQPGSNPAPTRGAAASEQVGDALATGTLTGPAGSCARPEHFGTRFGDHSRPVWLDGQAWEVALPQLKQQRDKLRQYQKRVAQQLERERALARQLLRDGRKERAKLLLKKKRYREQLLDKTESQISSLETMVQSIEFTQIEMKVIEGLQIGNECLSKMHQVMSIEEVEQILDETQEAVEYQRQIDELLAGGFTQEDEYAVLEELHAITQEHLELPEVPSEPLPEHPEKAASKARPRQVDLVAAS
ncbi:charged multivesicular body protein 6 [Tupaia chinensis]|uniref:charged multivesicular body protein 6 n=1 Tax=Tupaia chinensis TaxID=246437 RepID=UPI0003C91526|nr:charged multivesicular body protein 6 [Tupaia chinensis]